MVPKDMHKLGGNLLLMLCISRQERGNFFS